MISYETGALEKHIIGKRKTNLLYSAGQLHIYLTVRNATTNTSTNNNAK